jgi:lipopolysaccharide export system protein LptC
MRVLRPILLMVLLLGAAASWWSAQEDVAAPQPLATGGPREIDYYVTGLQVTRMNQSGQPAHRLHVASARHYTDDDTTELEKPHLTVFQATDPPWEIHAQRALASADGNLVLLSGEVLIERAGGATTSPMRVLTRELRVQPRQDYAETDEKVRVETDSDWLDAVGMQAWLRPPSRLKFLSQVKGHYVPR